MVLAGSVLHGGITERKSFKCRQKEKTKTKFKTKSFENQPYSLPFLSSGPEMLLAESLKSTYRSFPNLHKEVFSASRFIYHPLDQQQHQEDKLGGQILIIKKPQHTAIHNGDMFSSNRCSLGKNFSHCNTKVKEWGCLKRDGGGKKQTRQLLFSDGLF